MQLDPVESIKIAIPIITFGLGYYLKVLSDSKSRRRELASALLDVTRRWIETLTEIGRSCESWASANTAHELYLKREDLVSDLRRVLGEMKRFRRLDELRWLGEEFRAEVTFVNVENTQKVRSPIKPLDWHFVAHDQSEDSDPPKIKIGNEVRISVILETEVTKPLGKLIPLLRHQHQRMIDAAANIG